MALIECTVLYRTVIIVYVDSSTITKSNIWLESIDLNTCLNCTILLVRNHHVLIAFLVRISFRIYAIMCIISCMETHFAIFNKLILQF